MKVIDPYCGLNKSYLKVFSAERLAIPVAVQNNNEMMLKSGERAIQLKEVEITSRNDRSLNYAIEGGNTKGTEHYYIGYPYVTYY